MLKLFPYKFINVQLSSNYYSKRQLFEDFTDLTESLVSKQTNQPLRGQANKNSFKLISTVIGIGALCVAEGRFNGNEGTISIHINN